jgi:hypothetical protein
MSNDTELERQRALGGLQEVDHLAEDVAPVHGQPLPMTMRTEAPAKKAEPKPKTARKRSR